MHPQNSGPARSLTFDSAASATLMTASCSVILKGSGASSDPPSPDPPDTPPGEASPLPPAPPPADEAEAGPQDSGEAEAKVRKGLAPVTPPMAPMQVTDMPLMLPAASPKRPATSVILVVMAVRTPAPPLTIACMADACMAEAGMAPAHDPAEMDDCRCPLHSAGID